MATFRFSIEIGTDDDQIDPQTAEAHVRALREWLLQAPFRKLGTLFVSDVEVNPVPWDSGYAASITQGGFPILDPEKVAEALFEVFGHKPKVELIEPDGGPGCWLIPLPLTEMTNIASGKFDWKSDSGVHVLLVEFV